MRHRVVSHVQQHHRNANEPHDPNIVRFERLGFVPGISRASFRIMLFHSFTPRGFRETAAMILAGARGNTTFAGIVARGLVVAALLALYAWFGGLPALAFGYALPLVTVYPWFSWLSLLVEHRWFVECNARTRFSRECTVGRPTDYPGASGWLIKHFILPATDHYHLVHSLYPHVRWNYMRAIDRVLKTRSPEYIAHRSVGFYRSNGSTPSAMSELRERMTRKEMTDEHYAR